MKETFICEMQAQGRLVVPKVMREVMKLEQTDKVRVIIEKVGSD